MEPSGKVWPPLGTPALYALIISGFPTITLSTSSVRAEDTTDQSSYPLKSENATPSGDFNEYLSSAAPTAAVKTASTTSNIATLSLRPIQIPQSILPTRV